MFINFECKQCKVIFDTDVGEVDFSENPPVLENTPNCPVCGERTREEVWLTELGQSQLTWLFMGGEDYEEIEEDE